jgi:hypothetical protein
MNSGIVPLHLYKRRALKVCEKNEYLQRHSDVRLQAKETAVKKRPSLISSDQGNPSLAHPWYRPSLSATKENR